MDINQEETNKAVSVLEEILGQMNDEEDIWDSLPLQIYEEINKEESKIQNER